jgi:hypothetical protein
MSDSACLPTNFPVLNAKTPCSAKIIPCSVEQGIRISSPFITRLIAVSGVPKVADFEKFPVKFPVSRENEQSRGTLHCRASQFSTALSLS